jgi:uncharacterized protein
MSVRLSSFIVLFVLLTTLPAWALDLHQARASGMVGEKLDGYTTALKSTPDVQALVADVNAKRQAEYAKISKQNGQPVDVVAKLAAQQIVKNLEAGSSYQADDGGWRTR